MLHSSCQKVYFHEFRNAISFSDVHEKTVGRSWPHDQMFRWLLQAREPALEGQLGVRR